MGVMERYWKGFSGVIPREQRPEQEAAVGLLAG